MIYNNNNNNVSCGDFITVTSAQPQGVDSHIFAAVFLTGDTVTGGLGSQREGLLGVSSLSLALNSRTALCLCGLRTRFSGTFIRARPLANTDHPTGSNPLRWRNVSLTCQAIY